MITQEYLKLILNYVPETGLFSWLIKKNGVKNKVGYITEDGYFSIGIDRKYYKAHRLAWLYMTGSFPLHGIDHINRIKTDNRWLNLREATQSQNCINTGIRKSNKSGYKGVSWHAKSKKWQAKCKIKGKVFYIGCFDSIEKAVIAYKEFAVINHGEFYCNET